MNIYETAQRRSEIKGLVKRIVLGAGVIAIAVGLPALDNYIESSSLRNYNSQLLKSNSELAPAKEIGMADVVVKIERADGSEYNPSHEKSIPEVPFRDFGFMIENIDNIHYNANIVIDPGSISPKIYSLPGTWEQFQQKAFFPEDFGERVPAKITYLANNKIFIEPKDGLLPDKSQIVMSFSRGPDAGYIYRIFTK